MSKSLVTFVLDRSSSMLSILSGTLEAFNTYIGELAADVKKGGDPIDFTLVQFSSGGIDKTHFEKPIQDVPELTTETFVPSGMTPLIDAAFKTIKALEAAVAGKVEKPKVIVCIQTDGEENCSRDHTWADLKELIASKQAEGWQFNFMGAGIDAYQQASKMGLSTASTMSYSNDLASTRVAFVASATNTMEYRAGLRANTGFMAAQKMAAGDAYDPDAKVAQQLLKPVAPVQSRSGLQVDLGAGKQPERSKSNLDVTL